METHNGVIRFSPTFIKFALSSTEYFPGTLPVGCSSQGLCLKQPQEDLFSRISYMTPRSIMLVLLFILNHQINL